MQKAASLVWFKIFPAHFGGQKGIALFNKSLAKHMDVDCWCATSNEKVEWQGLNVLPVLPEGKSQFLNPLVWYRSYKLLRKGKYSFVIVEFPYYGLLGRLLKSKGVRYILHAHNIEAERFRQMKKWWWRLFKAYEKWVMNNADMVLFKTGADSHYAAKHYSVAVTKRYILPYGFAGKVTADVNKSRRYLQEKHGIKAGEKILLFAGTLDYLPNAEAVQFIYFQLLPLLIKRSTHPFKIVICGRNKFKEFAYLQTYKHENVIQAGHVEDIDVYFSGSDVFINPVQKAFGVQTKIVDAMSFNLNTVAFEEAQTGLPLYLLNIKLFIAKSKNMEDFCNKTIEALESTEETPAIFFEEYNWDTIVKNFVKKLEELHLKN